MASPQPQPLSSPSRPLTPRDATAALAVVVLWALNFIIGKVGLSQLPPLLMMALRFAVVAILLLPFLGRARPAQGRLIVAIAVVLGGGHFGLMFTGLAGVDAGPAAIAIQLTVPFSALLAAVFFAERLGRGQMLGMLIAFAGVYVLAGEPERMTSPLHLVLVVLAAFAWAVANVLIKRLGPINVFTLNGWVALLAVPQFIAASLVLEAGQLPALAAADWRAFAAVGYMAVASSIIAYGLWYYLIERYPMNRVVPLTLLSPVLAVVFAVLLLAEPLSATMAAGGALTLAGVALIEWLRPAAAEAQPMT
jgi:O-acetylserine/cysteine efflux transporter